jgi:hypothetical protein
MQTERKTDVLDAEVEPAMNLPLFGAMHRVYLCPDDDLRIPET